MWLQHLQRTDANRLTKQPLKYKQMWLQHAQRMDKTDYQNKHYNKKNLFLICIGDGHKQTTLTSTAI